MDYDLSIILHLGLVFGVSFKGKQFFKKKKTDDDDDDDDDGDNNIFFTNTNSLLIG